MGTLPHVQQDIVDQPIDLLFIKDDANGLYIKLSRNFGFLLVLPLTASLSIPGPGENVQNLRAA